MLHGTRETEAIHQYADRPDDTGLIDINLVGSRGDVVTARCANILDDRVQMDIGVELAQALDFIIDNARLDRTSARTVDAQDDAGRALIFKGRLQGAVDLVRAGIPTAFDCPANVDQRRMLAIRQLFGRIPFDDEDQDGDQIGQSGQFEKNTPATLGPNLFEGFQSNFFKHLPFPLRVVFRRFHVSTQSKVSTTANTTRHSRVVLIREKSIEQAYGISRQYPAFWAKSRSGVPFQPQ